MMFRRAARSIEVPCFVDIEQSPESLHAHAFPEGIEIRPGDTVLVHGAPSRVGYGEHLQLHCVATVTPAGLFGRVWARLIAPLSMVELFEVGFQPKEQA